jgi:hypothetical protein
MNEEQVEKAHVGIFIESLQTNIEKHGHTFLYVGAGEHGEPPFFYTLGLANRGWPELLLIGPMPPTTAQSLLNSVIDLWKEREAAYTGILEDFILIRDGGKARARLNLVDRRVAHTYTVQVANVLKIGDKYEVVQLLWPDQSGVLPDEEGFALPDLQTVLPVV